MSEFIQHGTPLDASGVCPRCAQNAGIRPRSGGQRDHDHATWTGRVSRVQVPAQPQARGYLDKHAILPACIRQCST